MNTMGFWAKFLGERTNDGRTNERRMHAHLHARKDAYNVFVVETYATKD